MRPVKLWVAQGFGVGRIPWAPGTFGSVVGLLWLGILVATGKVWVLLSGVALSLPLCVWLCGVAEQQLGRRDPASVVLDEIVALPFCFFSWIGIFALKNGCLPGLAQFCSGNKWAWTLGVFAAFRFFDILKPWPVRQSQSLSGGWGITIDDLLAAAYVNVLVVLAYVGNTMILR